MKRIFSIILILLATCGYAQKTRQVGVKSPNGKLEMLLQTGPHLQWSVKYMDTAVVAPSAIWLKILNGQSLGDNARIIQTKYEKINTFFNTPFYKKTSVQDQYTQLTITFNGGFGVILRVYNDGAAYRFFTTGNDVLTIQNEEANFNFEKDYKVFIPYVRDLRDGDKYSSSFEALYDEVRFSQIPKDTLAFLPMLVDLGNGKKVALLEADLEDYPGMYLSNHEGNTGLKAVFAKYPIAEHLGGFKNMNYLTANRAPYIAVTKGARVFPWRAVVISESDKDLANNDIVQRLSQPTRVKDQIWIKPGKVAWDWWNDWNISKVNFKAGINTETYKYYIDFAAKNKLEYVVLDEGWSESTNMLNISPEINLKELLDYAKQRQVGIFLWATWYAINKTLDDAFSQYAKMGVKGFKIDFIDRDDQKMVQSLYHIAAKAADYKLMIDFHGMYKPTGIQRVFPNIVNFEGVKGMENAKWTPHDNMPRYEVSIPFIRMLAGPMDYTPGAMRNSTETDFRPSNSFPMSQGTRCHQLAMYIIYEAPLEMLADSPTAYMKEQESTDFIAQMPTTFDETVALDGMVGEYVALARRKGEKWYAAGMTNWTPRTIKVDLSFLPEGKYRAEIFKDGKNAEKDATDYRKEIMTVSSTDHLSIELANGGGFAITFTIVK